MEKFYKTSIGYARALKSAGIALLLVMFLSVSVDAVHAQGASAQTGKRRITGTITDADGSPLVGATVYIKDTNVGTTTNTEGLFVIDVLPKQQITISYIGYLSQTLPTDGREVFNIKLQSDTDQLEEVVIVGYGKQKRQAMVSSIATVGSRDLMQSSSSNLTSNLAGQLAGLISIQRSADATPSPNTPQRNSAPAAIQRSADVSPFPGKPPHLTPQKPERTDCQRGGCMVGTRCVGVSRWSYLAPEASDGKVLCGHKPQSKPHLSEPGTHQRTWRVMGRPARQKTQTLSMTRRNDRTRHDHAAAPLADCPFVPPFIPQKKSPQAQTPRNSPKTKQHHLLRSFLSSLSSRSARAFSLNVFTLSSLRPCSIP